MISHYRGNDKLFDVWVVHQFEFSPEEARLGNLRVMLGVLCEEPLFAPFQVQFLAEIAETRR